MVAWLAAGIAAGVAVALVLLRFSAAVFPQAADLPLPAIVLAVSSAVLSLIAFGVVRRRRPRELEILRNREFLATVFDNTGDGIIVIDRNGIVQICNPAAERMFGYDPAEIVGRNVSMLLSPDERMLHDTYLKDTTLYEPKALGVQRTFSGRRKDGSAIPVEISVSTMQGPAGPLFIGVCHDLSSRLRAEEALRASEERLLDAIESLREGFVMFDADDRFVLCNTRYREMYDQLAPDLEPGRTLIDLLRLGVSRGQFPEAEGRVEEWIEERMRLHRGACGQIERRLTNGRWVKIEERRTRSGHFVGIRTDITELKRREQQLRESEERYRHLVDLLPDGVIVHVDGTVVFANDAMAEITGVGSRDKLIGRQEIDFIPLEDREALLARRQAASVTRAVEVREARYLRADGAEVAVERARAVISWNGKTAFLNLIHDITDRKRAEKEIMDARHQAETANRVKSTFLANVSHELRTPLNAIIGFSDLMAQEAFGPIAPGEYRDYADHIHGAGQHLLALINDILDLSKVEAGSEELMEEAIDVPGLVHGALLLVQGRATKGQVHVKPDLPDGLPPLYADGRKMKQILVNLLSNAVKFTGPGGTVTLSVRCRPGVGYLFRVTDTGIGMAADDIPKALAPFGQVANGSERCVEGTGLGLPLAKTLVELHGGVFALDSAPGVGTTVTMEFAPDRILPADPQIEADKA